MTTAAEHLALAAELKAATLHVQGTTDQALLRSLTAAAEFDYNAPLPPLNIAPRERLWEPAAVRYRDLPDAHE
jgi:hypothetical protein